MSEALAQTDAAVIIKLERVRDTCTNDDAADESVALAGLLGPFAGLCAIC
jgi:hypothetical protein